MEWAGDNPGIYLRKSPDGPWTGLGIFFRVLYSPHGQGSLMIILGDPDKATGFPDSRNVCLTTNVELTHYLINNFIKRFPSFRDQPGLAAMTWLNAESHSSIGDMATSWAETMRAKDCTAQMSWNDLGIPFAVEVGPKDCATGAHDMYSVFLEARNASITINDVPLTGQVCERLFFGRKMSTAFVAVSETWVQPALPEE
ncbi:MAG TPA: hypothetical protein DHW07_02260 [Gammaproteobacteria bacterium]|nr:hypothetical protein [Gammaproteobacteria bacterium]